MDVLQMFNSISIIFYDDFLSFLANWYDLHKFGTNFGTIYNWTIKNDIILVLLKKEAWVFFQHVFFFSFSKVKFSLRSAHYIWPDKLLYAYVI